MPTVDTKDIIDTLIENRGIYPGDENSPMGPVVQIVEYTNAWGKRTWGVTYLSEVVPGRPTKYEVPTDYILDPKVIWQR